MIRFVYKILAIVLSFTVFAGCVYDYEPKDKDIQGLLNPLVVIEGDIIAGGITTVKIGLTKSLLEDEEEIPLGASVWVESETGEIFAGTAVNDIVNRFEINTVDLDLNGRYRLGVSIPGRGEYLSHFKKVLISPQIDSITYSIAEDKNYVKIEATAHNNERTFKNGNNGGFLYCKWNYSENWESNALYPSRLEYNPKTQIMEKLEISETIKRQYCFSEAKSTGTYIANTEKLSENIIYKSVINEIPSNDTRLMGLYSITVLQTALDREAYIYWENQKNNTSGTGGLFGAQPSEIRGNIECTTSLDEVVLGYINVTTATHLRKFIDWTPVKVFKTDCIAKLLPKKDPESTSNSNTIWNSHYNSGYRPISYPEENITEEAYWAMNKCTDCRTYSNSTKPDFWPR